MESETLGNGECDSKKKKKRIRGRAVSENKLKGKEPVHRFVQSGSRPKEVRRITFCEGV